MPTPHHPSPWRLSPAATNDGGTDGDGGEGGEGGEGESDGDGGDGDGGDGDGGDGDAAMSLSFDPRLLVYEYSTGIVLRSAQVELVGKLVRGARTGRSICHQLLMGEGKTTVISPLLALLLADGSQLVMQIVPSSLLAFSLNVLRAAFTTPSLHKPVLSFTFDRRAEASEPLGTPEPWDPTPEPLGPHT